MSIWSTISSWIKPKPKVTVIPAGKTFTPVAGRKPAVAPAPTRRPIAAVRPVAGRSASQLAGLRPAPQKSTFSTISSWFRPSKPAQLAPGVAEKAMSYFLANPLSPATQAWAQTLPSSSANDTIRRELQIRALKQQLSGYTAEAAGLKSLYPTPGVNAQGQPTAYMPQGPFQGMGDVYSWLSGKYPGMYSPQGEIPGQELAGMPEYWRSSKDVFGPSQQGQ